MKNGSLIAAILTMSAVITSPVQAKTLTVGIALRLNDAYNDSVIFLKDGIETAKELFEKEHPGIKINLRVFSHTADLASVKSVADKMIAEHIPAVIGGEMSEEAIVFGDLLNDRKTVFLTPTASNPKVTQNKSFVFRGCFSDEDVANDMARYTVDNLKPKALGILHNISSPYTDYLSTTFTNEITRISSSLNSDDQIKVFPQKVLRRTLDFSNQIKFFKDNHVTHLAMFTHDYDLVQFVAQAEEQGFFPVYIGSDGWGTNNFIFNKFIKESKHDAKFVGIRNSYWKEDSNLPIAKQYRALYKKKTRRNPEAWSAIAFDSAWLLFSAMASSKDPTNSDDIRSELTKIHDIELVTTSRLSFKADNSPRKDLYLYRISNAGVQYEATLK